MTDMTATFVLVDLPRYHTWVIPIRIGEATVLVVSPYSSNIMVRFVSFPTALRIMIFHLKG